MSKSCTSRPADGSRRKTAAVSCGAGNRPRRGHDTRRPLGSAHKIRIWESIATPTHERNQPLATPTVNEFKTWIRYGRF